MVDLVLQRDAARADVDGDVRELLLYSQRITSRNRINFHVKRTKTSCSASSSHLSRDVPGRLAHDARIRSTRAAHPASAAWCLITTQRGGASQVLAVGLPSSVLHGKWAMKQEGTQANRE